MFFVYALFHTKYGLEFKRKGNLFVLKKWVCHLCVQVSPQTANCS